MPASSDSLCSVARKNQQTILNALALTGIAPVAEATGVDESTVTRWKEKDIPRFCKMLAAIGVKAVPSTMRCFDPKKIGAILALAKDHLTSIETTEQLQWDE